MPSVEAAGSTLPPNAPLAGFPHSRCGTAGRMSCHTPEPFGICVQTAERLAAAADTAVRVFAGYPGRLDAVVFGGDRTAIGRLRQDARLKPYFELAVERFLTVPQPRLAVLRDSARLLRAVRIRLVE